VDISKNDWLPESWLYVALSRVKKSGGLYIYGSSLDTTHIRPTQEAVGYVQELEKMVKNRQEKIEEKETFAVRPPGGPSMDTKH
jgi:hypothetical protein